MPNSPTGRPWPCPDHDDWVSRTFSHKSGSLDLGVTHDDGCACSGQRRTGRRSTRSVGAQNDDGRRCLTRARRQGQTRLRGRVASLAPPRGPGPWRCGAEMHVSYGERSGVSAGSAAIWVAACPIERIFEGHSLSILCEPPRPSSGPRTITMECSATLIKII